MSKPLISYLQDVYPLESQLRESCRVIELLLDHLPDSIHEDTEEEPEEWNWAWNEMGDETQQQVKRAREQGNKWLEGVTEEDWFKMMKAGKI